AQDLHRDLGAGSRHRDAVAQLPRILHGAAIEGHNSRRCCSSGRRRPKKRSKKSSPNQSNGLLEEKGLRGSTVFSTVMKTTAGVACRATVVKACESSRAADGTVAWGWAKTDMGRSNALASSHRVN